MTSPSPWFRLPPTTRSPTLATVFCLLRTVTTHPITENELQNLPGNYTEDFSWVVGDPVRNTFDIMTTCLVTMGLCVWTAIHLNIPAATEGPWHLWARNIQWLMVGLLAPELVVYQAWRQWVSARAVQQKVNKCAALRASEGGSATMDHAGSLAGGTQKAQGAKTGTAQGTGHGEWTMTHGQFAVMGGYTFDAETVAASGIVPARPLTLTSRGVALLADCDLLPPLSVNDIKDKSKADGMAKALVLLQAGWMLIQITSRRIEGLPVTCLEFNTLGHIACAFFIYVLWWHKPWTILKPVVLHGAWTPEVCAYMYMSSKVSDTTPRFDVPILRIFYKHNARPELEQLHFAGQHADAADPATQVLKPPRSVDPRNGTRVERLTRAPLPRTNSVDSQVTVVEPPLLTTASNTPSDDPVSPQRSPTASPLSRISFESDVPREHPHGQQEDETTTHRWKLASEAMNHHGAIGRRLKQLVANDGRGRRYAPSRSHSIEHDKHADTSLDHSPFVTEELLVPRASDWPVDSIMLSNFRGVVMGVVLWFASMVYGAIHAAAWYDDFPTELERWMWRSSSVYIVWSGGVWMMINLLGHLSSRFDNAWERTLAGQARWVTYAVLAVLCSVCGIAYGFARIFLVAESWISLRALTVEAYIIPEWTVWVPHLG